MTASERAEQIERDFNVPHPVRRMGAALARGSNAEVTPYTLAVAQDRIAEFVTKGFVEEDGAIILLMRGARREAVALAAGYTLKDVGEFIADIRHRLNGLTDLDDLIWEAQSNLDLLRRS